MRTLLLVLALMLQGLGSSSDAETHLSYTKAQIQNAIYKTAKRKRLNPAIALALVEVESTWNPNKVRVEPKGHTVSVGLFQMYYPTAKDMGYKGTPEGLKNPETNIQLGFKHLAKCQRRYGNDVRRVACCHNAGFYTRESVCKNDGWVIHYQDKVEKAYTEYKNFKRAI